MGKLALSRGIVCICTGCHATFWLGGPKNIREAEVELSGGCHSDPGIDCVEITCPRCGHVHELYEK